MYLMSINLKKIILFIIENIIKILWILPIKKNRILFISFDGKYSDSPKYIYEFMVKKNINIDYIWAINDEGNISEEKSKYYRSVKYNSFKFVKEFVTSHIVITNDYLKTYMPRRKGQLIINTWHGGSPLKTVGMVNSVSEYDEYFFKKHNQKYSAYISSSKFMTDEVFRKSFGYTGKIIKCGLPRNAILYEKNDNIKKKVFDYYGIPFEKNIGIVLYAPTFRGNFKNGVFLSKDQQFDIDECIRTLEKKYSKKFYFMFRAHHTFKYDINNKQCLMASEYPDMQELLYTADVLITDYSSCMGDMSLMRKPVFLYTPDLDSYILDRGFYWDIYSLPFPVAKKEKELYQNILDFKQERYEEEVKKYLNRLGSYEDPYSIKKIYSIIEKYL